MNCKLCGKPMVNASHVKGFGYPRKTVDYFHCMTAGCRVHFYKGEWVPNKEFEGRQKSAWNPRYEAYAEFHGRSPWEQRKHDKTNAEFMCFISDMKRLYLKSIGDNSGTIVNQDEFTAFIWGAVQPQRPVETQMELF